MECTNKSKNLKRCNCSYSCDKNGICCECIAYHRGMKQLPACYFPDSAEKTYDRSITHFIKLINEGKI